MPTRRYLLLCRLALSAITAIGPTGMAMAEELPVVEKRGPADGVHGVAGLIDIEEMIALRDAGEFVTAQERLDALRTAIEEGEATWNAYSSLFTAFRTGQAHHVDFLESWRAAMPWSAHPEAALGFRALTIGFMFRGDDVPSRTPNNALKMARSLFETAHEHYGAALERDPDHLVASSGLVALSRRGFAGTYLQRAQQNVDDGADRVSRMKSGVKHRLPQWGGSVDEASRFCHEQAALSDEFTADQCLAVGLVMGGPSGRALLQGAEVLLEADEALYAREITRALLFLRRADELIGLLERTGHRLNPDQLREAPIHELIYDQYLFWFRIDPGNPYVAQMTARFAIMSGKAEDASEALDHAITVNPFDADIHADKLDLLLTTGDLGAVLPAMETASDATDGNADGYLRAIVPVLGSLDTFRDSLEGVHQREFECRISRLVQTAERYCATTGSRPSYCHVTHDSAHNPYRDLWMTAKSSLGAAC